ncbi:hypothetical protein BTO02_22710 [Paraburkholderia sp. SOS3]|jgi:hypothetical protein|nr:hypothetical protein BTO02_22710 [Paraburkholderia sp. SOS3]
MLHDLDKSSLGEHVDDVLPSFDQMPDKPHMLAYAPVYTSATPAIAQHSPLCGLQQLNGGRRAPDYSRFVTREQQDAISTGSHDELNAANKSALAEAIRRSRQDHAFRTLACDDDATAVQDEPSRPAGTRAHFQLEATDQRPLLEKSVECEPPEVERSRRDSELSGQSDNNQAFRRHLERNGLESIPNSGSGNNCAIYSLVQQLRPHLQGKALDDEVGEIRARYDDAVDEVRRSQPNRPNERGKMLFFDTGSNSSASTLLDLINERYDVNVKVGVVQAGLGDADVVRLGTVRGSSTANRDYTHRLVVWDQLGHYEAVTAHDPTHLTTPPSLMRA